MSHYLTTNHLVNPLNNCICLRISHCYWFSFYSIILLYHWLKICANELTASAIGSLSWTWISGKPFLFSYISHCTGFFIFILADFKPTSCWANRGDTLAHEILFSFSTDCVGCTMPLIGLKFLKW